MGGWCVYYRPGDAGIHKFHTYRMQDEDFEEFERNFNGEGSSYEQAISEFILPDTIGGNNLEYLHLFSAELDADGANWTASAFQPDYHVLD